MIQENLFYNRDRNISGILAPEKLSDIAVSPVYGSKVNFIGKNISYETFDSFFNIIPNSPNSLSAVFSFRYDVNENDAQKIVNFFESKEGHKDIAFLADSGIYKLVSGYCDNYAINHINENHYEVAVEISVDQAPCLFNWQNTTFLNYNLQTYESGVSYKKYDVIYIEGEENKLNNFYYCKQDHAAKNIFNNEDTSFSIIYGSYTWLEAKEDAERRGGRLAVLKTFSAHQRVPYHTEILWIGASDLNQEGQFKWVDGSHVFDGYSRWAGGEPNNAGGTEHYACRYGVGSNYNWNDLPNESLASKGYILEMVDGDLWTREFFFEPDVGIQNDVKLDVKKIEFKNSFPMRLKTKNNIAPINISYKFSNISNQQLKSMLHFLETKGGYRKFIHQIPSVYNRPKVFICQEWTHTWKYYNCHDLEVTLVEDSLGIIPFNS